MPTFSRPAQRLTAVILGTVAIISVLVIAIAIPDPTSFQYTVFRIVLAVAVSGMCATIPGFLDVTVGATVRATGAIAVFAIVYFFTPASLALQPRDSRPAEPGFPPPLSRAARFVAQTDEAFAAQARFVGSARTVDTMLVVQIDSGRLSVPKFPPAGGPVIVDFFRVALAHSAGAGWDNSALSPEIPVGRAFAEREVLTLDPLVLSIPLRGVTTLQDSWLLFQLTVRNAHRPENAGFAYAHSQRGLFQGGN